MFFNNVHSLEESEPKFYEYETNYCKLYIETVNLNIEKDINKAITDKYWSWEDRSTEYYYSDKFENATKNLNYIYSKVKDNNYWLNVYTDKYNNLKNIDCYKSVYQPLHKNKYAELNNTYSRDWYMYSYSDIVVEWKGFEDNLNRDIYIYFIIWKTQYQLDSYNVISNTKFSINLPSNIKNSIINWNVVWVPYYQIKYCVDSNCIYTPEREGSLTNDLLSYQQYYLHKHNIIKARDSISNPKKVNIAIIDDGISLNHPDLTSNLWINSKEIPWNWVDDDSNWYVDDFNGWHFVYNSNNTKPLWRHWTKIAWIIGAEIDNTEWIGWILDNVDLMNIGVCNEQWCNTEDVIKWIKYAIDNGADIINLSLWWHQFNWYNQNYDDVLKEAYEKNIIVVIAWWNWDILSNKKNGVNTSINKLSPVCNYWDNFKNIIWIWAYISEWSNYWKCIDFYAMWDSIASTSFLENNALHWESYSLSDGTSFSAPIITWIIWLGYEKYWKIDRFIIYDSLKESINNWVIDAKKYLEILWSKIWNKKIDNNVSDINVNKEIDNNINVNTETSSEIDNVSKKKVDLIFLMLEKKYNKEDSDTQIIIYSKLKNKITTLLKSKIKFKLTEENILILNYLNELIIKKINSIDIWDVLSDFIN